MEVVDRIFDLVQKKKIEQKEFATLIGTTDKVVSAWRRGRTKSYTKYLPQIAEALDTSVEYLLTGTEVKKEPDTICADDVRQAEKLAAVLKSVGIDAERLTEADMLKVAKVIAAILQD